MSIVSAFVADPAALGLASAGIGAAALYQVRRIPTLLGDAVLRALTVDVTVRGGDEVFAAVERWLAVQQSTTRASRLMLVPGQMGWGESEIAGDHSVPWALTLGEGTHLLWRGGWPLLVTRSHGPAPTTGTASDRRGDTIRLRTIGRSPAPLRALVTDAVGTLDRCEQVRIWSFAGYWQRAASRAPRALSSVVLPNGVMQRLAEDLDWFEGARAWYAERGVPYRRGYLLSGAPGTGKTSAAVALASHSGRPLCALNLGSLSDDALFRAVSSAPRRAIVLLEDLDRADAAKDRRPQLQGVPSSPVPPDGMTPSPDGGMLGVSQAALLNVLDGVSVPDGRVFIATANDPDSVDPAVVRPGRFDVHERVNPLERDDQARMAARFYGTGHFEPLAHPLVPAAMQAAFMLHPDDPEAARRVLAADVRKGNIDG